MSINALLNDDSTKGWSNLYVNSLTTYKDLTVKGELKFESASGGSRVFTQTYNKTQAVLVSSGVVPIIFLEVGGIVTCCIPEFRFICTQGNLLILEPTSSTPSKYLPIIDSQYSIRVVTDENALSEEGIIVFETTGRIKITPKYFTGPSFSSSGFTDGKTVGTLKNQQFTYINKVANP